MRLHFYAALGLLLAPLALPASPPHGTAQGGVRPSRSLHPWGEAARRPSGLRASGAPRGCPVAGTPWGCPVGGSEGGHSVGGSEGGGSGGGSLRLRGGGHNVGAARKVSGIGLSHDQVLFREKASVAKIVPLRTGDSLGGRTAQLRHVPVPPNRFTPLKRNWSAISAPIVQTLRLQVRMNLKRRAVELRTCELTSDAGALARAADMLNAFLTGFSIDDALAMVRLEGIYIESFHVTDVKSLKGDHLSRAIGRIAGTGGKTKKYIEDSTRTRLVVADKRVHVMGSRDGITQARRVIGDLILGRPTAKANKKLAAISGRLRREF
ncbi:hypothetical protein T484DRAFT_3502496 [Baffinella frigidus]|nr:hypothetical protein T484DRAFT_3502496 [Cryptophyta sp. CCMP2293]